MLFLAEDRSVDRAGYSHCAHFVVQYRELFFVQVAFCYLQITVLYHKKAHTHSGTSSSKCIHKIQIEIPKSVVCKSS